VPRPSVPPNLARSFQGGIISTVERCERALVVPEVAELFRVTPGTIYKLARRHAIPCFKLGGSIRFDPVVLSQWMRGLVNSSAGVQ